jgi:hypothetical protein
MESFGCARILEDKELHMRGSTPYSLCLTLSAIKHY